MLIETNAPKVDRSLSIEYDFGGNIDSAIALFGAEVVYSNFEDNCIIALQGFVRRNLEKQGEGRLTDSEVREMAEAWMPGVGVKRGDPLTALITKFGKLSPEKQAELLAKLVRG